MTVLSHEEIEAAIALARGATPGPWKSKVGSFDKGVANSLWSTHRSEEWTRDPLVISRMHSTKSDPGDFAFISASRDLVPDLAETALDAMAERDRLRAALEKIAEEAGCCGDCEDETPEGVAPLATYRTSCFRGTPELLCDEHAECTRESYRKAASKGCGEQPTVVPHSQPDHVGIAIAALEGKP